MRAPHGSSRKRTTAWQATFGGRGHPGYWSISTDNSYGEAPDGDVERGRDVLEQAIVKHGREPEAFERHTGLCSCFRRELAVRIGAIHDHGVSVLPSFSLHPLVNQEDFGITDTERPQ